MGNKAAVNRLDDESGSKVVAKTATGTSGVLEVPVTIGGPSRTRTVDPLIKRRGAVMSRPSNLLADFHATPRFAFASCAACLPTDAHSRDSRALKITRFRGSDSAR